MGGEQFQAGCTSITSLCPLLCCCWPQQRVAIGGQLTASPSQICNSTKIISDSGTGVRPGRCCSPHEVCLLAGTARSGTSPPASTPPEVFDTSYAVHLHTEQPRLCCLQGQRTRATRPRAQSGTLLSLHRRQQCRVHYHVTSVKGPGCASIWACMLQNQQRPAARQDHAAPMGAGLAWAVAPGCIDQARPSHCSQRPHRLSNKAAKLVQEVCTHWPRMCKLRSCVPRS